MNVENRISVEEANTAFYRALESGMLERMDDVWAHDDWVRCVHPGWDLLTGWNRVRESWEMIFESGQKLRATPSDVWVHVDRDFAWVTCTENITVFNESEAEGYWMQTGFGLDLRSLLQTSGQAICYDKYVNVDGKRVVEPGTFSIHVAGLTQNLTLR